MAPDLLFLLALGPSAGYGLRNHEVSMPHTRTPLDE